MAEMEADLPVWPEVRSDMRLKIAETLAMETGVMTPIIKEELWTKVQFNRLKRGLDEMKVEFVQPVKADLTKDEEARAATRRERNREAAVRCRQKRKARQLGQDDILQKEKMKNEELRSKVQDLEAKKTQLMSILGLETHWNCPTSPCPVRSPPQPSSSLWTPIHPPRDCAQYTTWTPTPPPVDDEQYTTTWTPTPPPQNDMMAWTPPPNGAHYMTWTPPPPQREDVQHTVCSPTPPRREDTPLSPFRDVAISPAPPEAFVYDENQVVPGYTVLC